MQKTLAAFTVKVSNSHCCHGPSRERDAIVLFPQRNCCCATLGPGLPAAFPNSVHIPDPRTLAALGYTHAPYPSSMVAPYSVPQALEPPLLWASQHPRIWSHHCVSTCTFRPLFCFCILGACRSENSATTTTKVPTAGPGARRDPLSHSILMAEKEIRRFPAAFIIEDPNSPHSHFSHLQSFPVLIPADVAA